MKCKTVSGQTKLVVQDISPDLFYNNIYEKKFRLLIGYRHVNLSHKVYKVEIKLIGRKVAKVHKNKMAYRLGG